MRRCSNCDGIIKETAAVITTYIHPGEAGAVQWKVIKSKYDIEKAERVYCMRCINALVESFQEDEQIVVGNM